MVWIIMYRNRDGRQRKYTIGPHGTLTPEEARKEAKLRLADVVRGQDPGAEKEVQRKAMTVATLPARTDAMSAAAKAAAIRTTP
jgi:hypothetical protein